MLAASLSRFTVNRFIAARALACVLAGALLVFELLAADSGFHQALHHSGKAASNSCALCVFAKGHVDVPQSVPVVTASVRSAFDPAPLLESIGLVDFTYLARPSRAPPALASLLSVVA